MKPVAYVHEPQDDGRVIVRHPIKRQWAVICQPDEVEKAETAIDTRWRKMMFWLGSGSY